MHAYVCTQTKSVKTLGPPWEYERKQSRRYSAIVATGTLTHMSLAASGNSNFNNKLICCPVSTHQAFAGLILKLSSYRQTEGIPSAHAFQPINSDLHCEP